MTKPVTTDSGPIVQVSIVLDSGMFLTDAASPEEPFAEIGYFLPHIVVYGDYSEMESIDLDHTPCPSRIIHVRKMDDQDNEILDGVSYSRDFIDSLLRRKELYDERPPEILRSRFDWIFSFHSGAFRASSVKTRVFKEIEGYTHQWNGNRRILRPIAHDVVVHLELKANEKLVLINDNGQIWSSADNPKVTKRFDIEIVAPHRTAENYFRDAFNHDGSNYWLPNQGDPDPVGHP